MSATILQIQGCPFRINRRLSISSIVFFLLFYEPMLSSSPKEYKVKNSSFYTVVLKPVSGCSQVSGIARNLDPEFLRNLIQGLVYVQVSSEEAPQGELRSQVLVNGDVCSRRLPQPHHIAEPGTCYDGSKKYYNGTSWISEDDICTTCQCQVNAGDEGVWENSPPQNPVSKEGILGTRFRYWPHSVTCRYWCLSIVCGTRKETRHLSWICSTLASDTHAIRSFYNI